MSKTVIIVLLLLGVAIQCPSKAVACEDSVSILNESYCKEVIPGKSSTMVSPNPNRKITALEVKEYKLVKDGVVIGSYIKNNTEPFYSYSADIPGKLALTVYVVSTNALISGVDQEDIYDVQFIAKNQDNTEKYRFNLNNWESIIHEYRNDNIGEYKSPFTLIINDHEYEGLFDSRILFSNKDGEDYNEVNKDRFRIGGSMKRKGETEDRFSIFWNILAGKVCIKDNLNNEWISKDTESCDSMETFVNEQEGVIDEFVSSGRAR